MFRWQPKAIIDKHTNIHVVGSFGLVVLLSLFFVPAIAFCIAFVLGILWEVADGFKPDAIQDTGAIRTLLLTSDGASWSDVMFDFLGCVAGIAVAEALSGEGWAPLVMKGMVVVAVVAAVWITYDKTGE